MVIYWNSDIVLHHMSDGYISETTCTYHRGGYMDSEMQCSVGAVVLLGL